MELWLLYFAGVAIWVGVCGYLGAAVESVAGLLWPILLPLLMFYGIGSAINQLRAPKTPETPKLRMPWTTRIDRR